MPYAFSWAYDINNSGQIVGQAMKNLLSPWDTCGFVLTNGVCTELPGKAHGINDAGQVVGIAYFGNQQHAYMYDGSMHDLGTLGGQKSIAYKINNNGQIVGESWFNDNWDAWHAFLYSGGVMHDLGAAGGVF